MPDVPRPAAVLIATFAAAMTAVMIALHRPPPPRFRATPTASGVEITTSVWRAIGVVLFAWTGAGVLGLWALSAAPHAGAYVLGAGALWCAWSGLCMVVAPRTRGTVLLTRDGLTYTNQRFRATLGWDDIAAGAADENRMALRLAVVPGQVVTLGRRPGSIRRPRPTVPDVLTVSTHMLGVLPTDLLRVVAHYTQATGVRGELDTELGLARVRDLCAMPVRSTYTEQELRRTAIAPGGPPVDVPEPSFAVSVLDPYSAALTGAHVPSSGGRRPLLAAAARENRAAARGLHWTWALFGVMCLGIGAIAISVDPGDSVTVGRGVVGVATGVLLLASAVIGTVSSRRRARRLLEIAAGRPDT